MAKLSGGERLFVSKLPKVRLSDLRAGAELVKRTGLDIDAIIAAATTDRVRLAREHLKSAVAIAGTQPPQHRDVISRAYYAMYHAFRAVVFFMNSGDDYEKHDVLPGKLPDDLPDRSRWERALKNARLERNRADYDPTIAKSGGLSRALVARNALKDAEGALTVARAYLRSKGWKP